MAPKCKAPVEGQSAVSPLHGCTLVFGVSNVTQRTIDRLGEAINSSRCRVPEPKGEIPKPKKDEVVVLRDMFEAGLRFPLDPIIVDILKHLKI